jgi:hypothetical protein
MHAARTIRSRTNVGRLLLVLQLAATAVIPLVHQPSIPGTAVDHAEAPGTPHHGHGDAACAACRLAETRFAETPPALRTTALAVVGTAVQPSVATGHEARRLRIAAAPRAPPLPALDPAPGALPIG